MDLPFVMFSAGSVGPFPALGEALASAQARIEALALACERVVSEPGAPHEDRASLRTVDTYSTPKHRGWAFLPRLSSLKPARASEHCKANARVGATIRGGSVRLQAGYLMTSE